MSETRDDLREALARCINPETFAEGSPDYYGPNDRLAWASAGQRVALKTADKCLSGPLAPILAQVSALQAEVERLQKVEGEREKGRVPDGTGLSPKGEAPDGSSSQATSIPRAESKPTRRTLIQAQARRHYEHVCRLHEMISELGGRLNRSQRQLKVAQSALARIDRGGKPMREIAGMALLDIVLVPDEPPAPCDRSGAADETRRGSAKGESTVTGAARQAPVTSPSNPETSHAR